MKRVFRFFIIIAAMIAGEYAVSIFFAPVIGQFTQVELGAVNETAVFVYAMCIQSAAAVIFITAYIKWYIATPENKRYFLSQTTACGYDTKTEIIRHMRENNGFLDIILYAIYSIVFPISVLLSGGAGTLSFLYFQQLIFYNLPEIINLQHVGFLSGFIFGVAFFIGGYILGLVIVYRIWDKNRLRR